MVRVREIQHVKFGFAAEEGTLIGDGWGEAEDGFRWMLGNETTFRVPRGQAGVARYLAVFVTPPWIGGNGWPQRLATSVDGKPRILPIVREPTLVMVRIDPEAGSDAATVYFSHPDWVQPSALFPEAADSPDSRKLALSVTEALLLEIDGFGLEPSRKAAKPSALTDPAPAPFDQSCLKQFASLGDNCEFGLYQRRAGFEPPDLFRFSRLSIETLLIGLEGGLSVLCDPSEITLALRGQSPDREYVIIHGKYRFFSHTHVTEGSMPVSRLIEREIKKLFFLRRLMLDDLRSASRLFVFKSNDPIPDHDLRRLSDHLQRYGDNTLLYVREAAPGVAPGHVERTSEHILTGHVDRFLDYMRADIPGTPVWDIVCGNAYRLWRGAQAKGRTMREPADMKEAAL